MTKLFNSHYINIVEKNSVTKLKTFDINFENTSIQSIRNVVNSNKKSFKYYKNYTAQKIKLSIKYFFSKCEHLVTCTNEILNEKLHFLRSGK